MLNVIFSKIPTEGTQEKEKKKQVLIQNWTVDIAQISLPLIFSVIVLSWPFFERWIKGGET